MFRKMVGDIPKLEISQTNIWALPNLLTHAVPEKPSTYIFSKYIHISLAAAEGLSLPANTKPE